MRARVFVPKMSCLLGQAPSGQAQDWKRSRSECATKVSPESWSRSPTVPLLVCCDSRISSRPSGGEGRLAGKERQQRRVDLVGMRPTDVVRAVGHLDNREIGDQSLVAESSRGDLEGKNSVGGAVDCQDWDVDLWQVAAEVGEPRFDTRVRGVRAASGCDLRARTQGRLAHPFRHGNVGVVNAGKE